MTKGIWNGKNYVCNVQIIEDGRRNNERKYWSPAGDCSRNHSDFCAVNMSVLKCKKFFLDVMFIQGFVLQANVRWKTYSWTNCAIIDDSSKYWCVTLCTRTQSLIINWLYLCVRTNIFPSTFAQKESKIAEVQFWYSYTVPFWSYKLRYKTCGNWSLLLRYHFILFL